MSRWFRHYAGMMRDDKLVSAALKAKQPIERVVWLWGAILENAAEINDNGRYDLDAAEVAYFLRADEADIRSILDALSNAGRVAESRVVNWSARQFQSDRSAPRQAAYRERKRSGDAGHNNIKTSGDGGVTSLSRHGDAPELDTELDTEKEDSEPNGSGAVAPVDPPEANRRFFKAGKVILGQKAGGQLTKLLRSRHGSLDACSKLLEIAAKKENPTEYIAAAIIRGPPQFEKPASGFVGVLEDQFRREHEPDSNFIDLPAVGTR